VSYRGSYEFPKHIKESARTEWHKKNPGNEDANLEVHHILNIHHAILHDVPIDAVRSNLNAVAVRRKFHKEIHREQTDEDQEEFANWFKSIWVKLF